MGLFSGQGMPLGEASKSHPVLFLLLLTLLLPQPVLHLLLPFAAAAASSGGSIELDSTSVVAGLRYLGLELQSVKLSEASCLGPCSFQACQAGMGMRLGLLVGAWA